MNRFAIQKYYSLDRRIKMEYLLAAIGISMGIYTMLCSIKGLKKVKEIKKNLE